jgi:hypothetical protein
MIAIPVMRGRVAPVLNWCSRLLIFPARPEGTAGKELWLPDLTPWERLQELRQKGVSTLICGALSGELQVCAVHLGLKIIPGVAGEIDLVLKAYWQDRLDRPEFLMPGCRGARRYRQGMRADNCPAAVPGQGSDGAGPGAQGGRRGGRGPGVGAGGCRRGPGGAGVGTPGVAEGTAGQCTCPACGARVAHERGIPCVQVTCPRCGQPMERVQT